MSDLNAPQSFSWGKLIHDLRLQGLPALIACHTEPRYYDASVPQLDLLVDAHLEELGDSPAMQRLKDRLVDHFGSALQLNVAFGPAPNSPAALAQSKRVGRFAQAYSTIAQDDLVAQMIEQYSGKIVIESVKPAKKSNP